MLYEISRQLAYLGYQRWITMELFSTGWFIMVGVLVVIYTVWLKLVDKRRLRDLLLLGSLIAVGFTVADTFLIGNWGVSSYNVSLFPGRPPLFVLSLTVGPIMFMLIQQYTTSWKEYLTWTAIGSAAIAFGLMPFYVWVGILQFYKWNYIYHFFLTFTAGTIGRAILLWIINIEQSQSSSIHADQASSVLRPAATKPLDQEQDNNSEQ
jgi:hypothetical protein